MADIRRLSLNQATTQNWSIREAVEGCVRHDIPSIALWRHKIAETGLDETVRLVEQAGLHVSSVCRGGMFPAATAAERQEKILDNFRAIDEAAALHADSLVLVVGSSTEVPIADARKMVVDGLAEIVPQATKLGVRIGLEPLHPMYAGDRSVLNLTSQALEMASRYNANEVGLILDAFHIWWDPDIFKQIAHSKGRIFGFHVCDWLVPMPDMLLGRGMMGDGVIDNRALRTAVDEAGYNGPIEVEIFNQELWDRPGDEVLALTVERFNAFV
ncbi:MAG: sugar phosphate isomerase/epimerase family protein [Granulicella sp.]